AITRVALYWLMSAVCTTAGCQNLAAGSTKSERELLPYSNGDGRWGYINQLGDIVVPAEFASATYFFGGFGIVQDMDRKCGYVNSNGKLGIPVRFTFCGIFSEGLATVQFNNR